MRRRFVILTAVCIGGAPLLSMPQDGRPRPRERSRNEEARRQETIRSEQRRAQERTAAERATRDQRAEQQRQATERSAAEMRRALEQSREAGKTLSNSGVSSGKSSEVVSPTVPNANPPGTAGTPARGKTPGQ